MHTHSHAVTTNTWTILARVCSGGWRILKTELWIMDSGNTVLRILLPGVWLIHWMPLTRVWPVILRLADTNLSCGVWRVKIPAASRGVRTLVRKIGANGGLGQSFIMLADFVFWDQYHVQFRLTNNKRAIQTRSYIHRQVMQQVQDVFPPSRNNQGRLHSYQRIDRYFMWKLCDLDIGQFIVIRGQRSRC